jgi:hypothetical protein
VTLLIHVPGALSEESARRARHTLRDRGDELLAELAAQAALATDLQLPLAQRVEVRDGLIALCTSRLVRHRLATDQVLYAIAARSAKTRLLVRALRAQHDLVAARIAEVKRADSSAELAAAAHALIGLLEVCHLVEQEVLIPALAMLPGVDLSALVGDMDTLLAGCPLDAPEVLDVREIPHGRRHPRIFGIYARLTAGESARNRCVTESLLRCGRGVHSQSMTSRASSCS